MGGFQNEMPKSYSNDRVIVVQNDITSILEYLHANKTSMQLIFAITDVDDGMVV